ncbi:MAG: triose-phosphate isomerase, partial [Anaerolineae bacterium]|nr:triose-phosphate isomerase [Anaerolineae bacterium]
MRTPIVAANWKMHKTIREAVELTREVQQALRDVHGIEVVLCPPFTALSAVRDTLGDS